jgi:hypothetical protein
MITVLSFPLVQRKILMNELLRILDPRAEFLIRQSASASEIFMPSHLATLKVAPIFNAEELLLCARRGIEYFQQAIFEDIATRIQGRYLEHRHVTMTMLVLEKLLLIGHGIPQWRRNKAFWMRN